MTDGPCIVCAATEERLNPRQIGPLLEEYCGLLRPDAMVQVSRGMGVLAAGMYPDAAAVMVEALAEIGVDAFAVAESRVPELGRAMKPHMVLDVREDCFIMQPNVTASPQPVPWSALVVGVATQPQTRQQPNVIKTRESMYTGQGSTMNVTRTRLASVQPAKWNVVFGLRNRQGAVRTFEVTEKNVLQAYLGERALPSADLSFPLFLADVAARVPRAFLTEGYQAAARGDRLHVTKVATPRHRDNAVRWALCCAAHRGLLD